MQFKHPEILYALLLLIIPILVHLFQLRKFKKEYFTNVNFLKELSIQTRKSSKLKKWLLLTTRLLLLAFLILAFAQPFFKSLDSSNSNNELFVVLDNSFSMQSKGQKGELLKRAVQDLLENTPQNKKISLITNNDSFYDTNINVIEKDLQTLNYSAIPFSLEMALTKIKNRKTFNNKDVLVITDAIGMNKNQLLKNKEKDQTTFYIPEAENLKNIAIDSVYLSQNLDNFYEIEVQFSSSYNELKSIPVSLFNNQKLIAKTILNSSKAKETIKFTIPKEDFHGNVSITDNSLNFDNTYYFSISKPKVSNVLSIGSVEKNNFLSRIYTQPEFNYTNSPIETLDYALINKQDAIVLNELATIPNALQTNLKSFLEKGGNIIYIPNENSEITNTNQFLRNFGAIQFENLQVQEKKITTINFSNPLFSNVFEKKITNFQYPIISKSFLVKGISAKILSLEDQSPFLSSITKSLASFYVFSAPINKQNSNFQNSPLIVPTFYKMGQNSEKNGVKSETIGSESDVLFKTDILNNQIVSIKNKTEEFIPSQQIMAGKLKISCSDNPTQAGNFELMQNKKAFEKISFNYDRSESRLTKPSSEMLSDLNKTESISSYLDKINIQRTDSQLWKWFVIFALLFLVLEIIIQKFIK